jgi:hypothetical protein
MEKPQPNSNELYSHHVFLFPFKWAPAAGSPEHNDTFGRQTALKEIIDAFKPTNWESKAFKIDSILSYTEYNYFLDYVREILYDLHEDGNPSPLYTDASGADEVIQHFEYKRSDRMYYRIKIRDREAPYELEIQSFFLHLYYTGVGVFSFHLNNKRQDQSAPDDILAINQYGRRIYPIYFDINQEQVGDYEIFNDKNFEHGLVGQPGKRDQAAQSEVLAEYIEVEFANRLPSEKKNETESSPQQTEEAYVAVKGHENFQRYKNYEEFKYNPFLLPVFIAEFLPKGLFCTHENPNGTQQGKYFLNPALDDRMFLVCWYGNTVLARAIGKALHDNLPFKEKEEPYLDEYRGLKPQLDWWYKYIFVNYRMVTCQNAELRWESIRNNSNLRWRDQGTFYGITSYSLVMLTVDLNDLKASRRAFLVTYLQTIYYKLAELVLVQRATVERFADEVTHISRLDEKDKLPQKVTSLYRQYIRFVNKIYFREVTAQALGAELYEALQDQANVARNVKDLSEEIQELHNYVQQSQEFKRSQRLEIISNLTAAFLGPSLLIGFYGMNVFPQTDCTLLNHLGLVVITICAILTAMFSMRIFENVKNDANGNQPKRFLGIRRTVITAFMPFGFAIIFPSLLVIYEDTSLFDYLKTACEKYEERKNEQPQTVPQSPSTQKDTITPDSQAIAPTNKLLLPLKK